VPDSAFAADVRTCVARLFDSVNPENRRARQRSPRRARLPAGVEAGNGARVARFNRLLWRGDRSTIPNSLPQAVRSPSPAPEQVSLPEPRIPLPRGERRNSEPRTGACRPEFMRNRVLATRGISPRPSRERDAGLGFVICSGAGPSPCSDLIGHAPSLPWEIAAHKHRTLTNSTLRHPAFRLGLRAQCAGKPCGTGFSCNSHGAGKFFTPDLSPDSRGDDPATDMVRVRRDPL